MRLLVLSLTGLIGSCSGPYSATDFTDAEQAVEATDVPGPLEELALTAAPPARSWSEIAASGRLRVALPNDSTSYFQYRGMVLGLELQALESFARSHDLELSVTVRTSVDARVEALRSGEVDLIGGRLAAGLVDVPGLRASSALYAQTPTVVQRESSSFLPRPCGPSRAPYTELESCVVARPSDLLGRRVPVSGQSPWVDTLTELESADGDVVIVEVKPASSTETLLRAVSSGEERLTVAGEDLAKLVTSHYGGAIVRPKLGEAQPAVLAGRAGSEGLMRRLDRWIARHPDRLASLHRRYFKDRRGYQERVDTSPLAGRRPGISDYDELLREHAPIVGYDWRLIAAQTYQESRFKPRARSWAGARGLMQLMPRTGRELGVRDPWDPEQNIIGGITYLEWMDRAWREEITDPEERVKFVLASYNAGRGHVLDAQRLARRAGADATQWEQVAPWMLQLSRRAVYRDPIVRHGFCRGLEPVLYVSHILARYDHYRQLVPETPSSTQRGGGPDDGD